MDPDYMSEQELQARALRVHLPGNVFGDTCLCSVSQCSRGVLGVGAAYAKGTEARHAQRKSGPISPFSTLPDSTHDRPTSDPRQTHGRPTGQPGQGDVGLAYV